MHPNRFSSRSPLYRKVSKALARQPKAFKATPGLARPLRDLPEAFSRPISLVSPLEGAPRPSFCVFPLTVEAFRGLPEASPRPISLVSRPLEASRGRSEASLSACFPLQWKHSEAYGDSNLYNTKSRSSEAATPGSRVGLLAAASARSPKEPQDFQENFRPQLAPSPTHCTTVTAKEQSADLVHHNIEMSKTHSTDICLARSHIWSHVRMTAFKRERQQSIAATAMEGLRQVQVRVQVDLDWRRSLHGC